MNELEDATTTSSNPHHVMGQRVMIRLGGAGLLVLLLGFGLPWFFSAWASFVAGPDAAPAPTNEANSVTQTVVLVLGIVLIMLAAVAGVLLGTVSQFQQKYGTKAALGVFTPPVLLFAALLAVAFR